jgi:hypothetical protein
MIPKLSDACYAVWIMFMISYIDTPWMIYFASIHYVIKYEIILGGGNSSDMARTFIFQKKNRIMAGVGSRSTCRRLFKNLHILPVQCQYSFTLTFVLDKWEMFR